MKRKSLRTDELTTQICDRLSLAEPLTRICADLRIGVHTVYDWIAADPELAAQFARARELGGDKIAEDALKIADDLSDDPASRRVRVETRLKLLAKWCPKRYGDRTVIAGDKDNPVQTYNRVEIVGIAARDADKT